ncbi:MAG: 2-phosphosulfolactate phosphatase [Thermoflavifilum sp.]|nr:2-phosphosulfolactate phosphatase [Thermoflavifilum sp.]
MDKGNKPSLEVSLSPALLHLYDLSQKIVVVIDVLRATSTICTALHHGAQKVIPVDSVEKCIEIGRQLGAITAGERDGQIAPGLEHGNSPLEYPASFIQGKTLVLTTTNGTRLLHMAKDAEEIVIGSFLNLSIVCDYLVARNRPVVLACAGWKDRINLEDSVLAGAILHRIKSHFDVQCDAALIAEQLYLATHNNLMEHIQQASHYKRLSQHGFQRDIAYCLKIDQATVLPLYRDGAIERA